MLTTQTTRSLAWSAAFALLVGCGGPVGEDLDTNAESVSGSRGTTSVSNDRCTEIIQQPTIDPNHLQQFLPEGYQLHLFAGMGVIELYTARCETYSINGTEQGPTTFSLVSIWVEPPAGAPPAPGAINTYTLGAVTNNATLYRRLRHYGFPVEYSEDIAVIRTPALPSGDHTTHQVNSASWSYSGAGDTGAPVTGQHEDHWIFWHTGAYGRAAFDFTTVGDDGFGQTLIYAPAGSRMAQLMNATESPPAFTAAAFNGSTGTIALVP